MFWIRGTTVCVPFDLHIKRLCKDNGIFYLKYLQLFYPTDSSVLYIYTGIYIFYNKMFYFIHKAAVFHGFIILFPFCFDTTSFLAALVNFTEKTH